MRGRRAKEKDLSNQALQLKRLSEEIKKLESENGSAVSEVLVEKRNKYAALSQKNNQDKAAYKPFNINFITIPHNLIMCIYSLYTFIGTSLVLLQNLKKVDYDFYYLVCDPDEVMYKGIDFWVYTFYLSKYVEYLDTFFLLLKAKPVMPPENSQYLLHIYHHAITAAIVWGTIFFHFSTSWTGPWTNSFVHTLMYGYYFLAELNKIDRSLGGKFITPIQLIQFMFCLSLGFYELSQSPSCGTDVPVFVFMLLNYIIFFGFFVKIWLDKKRERIQVRRPNEEKKKVN